MMGIDSSLLKEVCATSGDHDSREKTWFMFPGADVFASIPFHTAHSILKKEAPELCEGEVIFDSEKDALADKISPGVLRSLVIWADKTK